MVEYELFPNAPITEALIDLRVQMRDGFVVGDLEPAIEEFKKEFPVQERRFEQTATLQMGPGAESSSVQSRQRLLGSALFSEARDHAIQVRINGFTYSKMKPYQDWHQLSSTTARLWKTYNDLIKPKTVVRLASRFINRIDIPLGADFDTYLKTGVRIADGLLQALAEVFFRVVVPHPSTDMVANISTNISRHQPVVTYVPYIFDIDVYRPVDCQPTATEIWEKLDEIRDYKDEIFHKSMTEVAKEMFR